MWCRGCHRSSCELCWCDDSEAEPTHISNVLAVSCQSCLSCLSCLSWLSWILCGLCVGVAFQLTMQRMPLKNQQKPGKPGCWLHLLRLLWQCCCVIWCPFAALAWAPQYHTYATLFDRYTVWFRVWASLVKWECVCVCALTQVDCGFCIFRAEICFFNWDNKQRTCASKWAL